MAKKLKLGSQIVSLSDEAFSNVGRPDAAPSVSPYQSALQGSQPDQAKMTGSSAQLGAQARKLAAPPTDTLRESIRSRQPMQAQGTAGARPFNYEKAARVDEALAGVFAQQMTLAEVGSLGFDRDKALAAGYSPTQLDTLKPVIDKLLARQTLSAAEDSALKTLFQSDPNYTGPESMREIAANLVAEPDDAIVTALKDQIKQGNADFTFSAIPKDKLDKVLLAQGLAEKTKDGEVDYSYIEDVLGPNWHSMSYQDWLKEVTKRRESFTDVKQLQLLYKDPQLAPAAKYEVRQQLLDLGYSGVLEDMSAAEKLEAEARNGYSLTIGGKSYAVDEILDGVVLEGVVSSALAAGPGSDKWNEMEPELKEWMEDNYYSVREQYKTRTGLIETGLGEGIQRALTAEQKAIQEAEAKKQLEKTLNDNGFNSKIFMPLMDLDKVNQLSAYATIPNGIITLLKMQTDSAKAQEMLTTINTILSSENQELIDMMFKEPRWVTVPRWEQVTTTSMKFGRPVYRTEYVLRGHTTKETAAAQMFRELKGLPTVDAHAKLQEWKRNQTEYNNFYNGSPEEFAKVVLGVDNPSKFISELNDKYQNPNISSLEKNRISGLLDYNQDGQISIQDFVDRQASIVADQKKQGIVDPTKMVQFGFEEDISLQNLQKRIQANADLLGNSFIKAQQREKQATAGKAYDDLMAPHLADFKEFNLPISPNVKKNFIDAYVNKGPAEAEKIISQLITNMNFEQLRAEREASQEERRKREENNTNIFTGWATTYGVGGIDAQVNYRSRLTQGNTFTSNYTPYQRTQDHTFWVLRLRLENSKIMPPGYTSYEQMEESFYKNLREGRDLTHILERLHLSLRTQLRERLVEVTYQEPVGPRGATIPTTIYVNKKDVDPQTGQLKKGVNPISVQKYDPETGLLKKWGT